MYHTRLSIRGFAGMIVLVLLAAAASVADTASAADNERQPNIIFLLTDDVRYDTLGAMGNPIIHTPHLDHLAAEGVLFTNMFCTTSICATSRASFVAGQYARRHGINDFATPFSAEAWADTFPARLRKCGYRLGFAGKWGLGNPMPEREYDVWHGFPGQGRYFPKPAEGEPAPAQPPRHLTHRLGDQAVEFIASCTADQPFCLQVSFKAAHVQDREEPQFQPDPQYASLYTDVEIPVPVLATAAAFDALPEFLQTSESRVRWRLRFATPEMFQQSVKDYYRLITGIDDVVGRISAALDERHLAANTIIIYTSDNGFFLGERGLAGKWFMYEESIRLPLLIYDPRLPDGQRGTRNEAMALSIDVAPTILDYAACEIPMVMQGRSLRPLVEGKMVDWRGEFFYEHMLEHPRIPRTEGVRTSRWKYSRYIDFNPPVESLFDLQTDPGEEHDLAGDPAHADQLAAMRQRCDRLRDAAK